MRWRLAVLVLASASFRCQLLDNLTKPSGLAIQKFTASPATITPGTAVTLTWDVVGADTVQIDNSVGTVAPKGSKLVQPEWTTTYTLAARGGTSSATATLQVIVQASPGPTPTPSPTPTPTPTPSPSASPTPTPTPSPSPSPGSCGAPVASAGSCSITTTRPTPLAEGECLELTLVTLNQSCPVAFGTTRSLRFDLTAHTPRSGLTWRRAPSSPDALLPASGAVDSNGATSAVVSDIVLDASVTIEVLDGDAVLLSFAVKSY